MEKQSVKKNGPNGEKLNTLPFIQTTYWSSMN